ncbi:MAG: hypothetical protein E7495_04805 [Ruminococcus flavefaciens]|nr:hypothetical protein [Ruminococcus flavefaciens]
MLLPALWQQYDTYEKSYDICNNRCYFRRPYLPRICEQSYSLSSRCNALGISYITGIGEFRCNYPHLRPAFADGIEECIPGMIAGGPNKHLSDLFARKVIPDGTPPMKCYADDTASYSLNEITIYWNSPTVFVLAYLCSEPQ